MNVDVKNPFDSIESAHEFLTLLAATVVEAKGELEADVAREALNPSRRLDGLRVALYNLKKLEAGMARTRRALNDLRTLRRLLFEERSMVPAASAHSNQETRSQSVTVP
jgi:hypothetical protein